MLETPSIIADLALEILTTILRKHSEIAAIF